MVTIPPDGTPSRLPGTEAPERCPDCRARVRVDDTWCSLCHARLHDAPGTGNGTGTGMEREVSVVDVEAARGTEPGGDATDSAAAEASATAARLLAELSVVESSTGLPGRLGALRGAGRGAGIALATVGGLVMVAVLVGCLAVAGTLL